MKFTIYRTDKAMPILAIAWDSIRDFLFGCIDGFGKDDKRAWRRLWKRIKEMEAGEMLEVEMKFPRSSKFHRFHMGMERALYDQQERFTNFDQFRNWLAVGSGWCDWCAGAKGGVIPIAKSISYAKADEEEFHKFHEGVIDFLRSGYVGKFLWKHLTEDQQAEMIEGIIHEFDKEG